MDSDVCTLTENETGSLVLKEHQTHNNVRLLIRLSPQYTGGKLLRKYLSALVRKKKTENLSRLTF